MKVSIQNKGIAIHADRDFRGETLSEDVIKELVLDLEEALRELYLQRMNEKFPK